MSRLTPVVLAAVALVVTTTMGATSLAHASTTPFSAPVIAASPANAGVLDLSNDMVATPALSKSAATRSTDAAAPDSTSSTRAAQAEGTETIWVEVLKVTATADDDTNANLTDTGRVAAYVKKLNAYWNAESNGAVSIALGGYEVRSLDKSTCEPNTLFSDVPKVAFDGAFAKSAWKGTGKHLLILTAEGCDRTGLGSVGGDGGVMLSGNGLSDDLGVPVGAHEFGHNLGFGHSGASLCESATAFDGTNADFDTNGSCPTNEYGDYLDIMGYSITGALPHLSSAQRIHNGYLDDYTDLSDSTGSTTVTVGNLDGTAPVRAVAITDPKSGDKYYVEFRAATGTDATSTEFTRGTQCAAVGSGYTRCARDTPDSGAVRIIRELPYRTYTDYKRTTVIAAGIVGSDLSTRHTHLLAGDTFSSVDGTFSVRVNSIAASTSASVTVHLGETAATTTKLSLSANRQTYGQTARVTATATVARVDGVVPDGTVQFFEGSTPIGTSVVAANGTAVLRVRNTIATGTHLIVARFIPGSLDDAASTSEGSTFTVKRATSKTAIALASRTVASGSSAKIRVSVTVAGVTPTGTLVAYANGKKLKSYTLSSASKGSTTITLPRLSSDGKKKITVSFSSSRNIAGGTSAAKALTVRN